MKGLFIRLICAVGLLLWAIDMVFPWQRVMQAEENPYTAIQTRGKLVVGTLNNPVSYFIGSEGAAGLEYELTNAFADYLGVELDIMPMSSAEELFSALANHKIDIAAAKILLKERYLEYFAKTITNIITCIYPTISAIRVGVEYVKSKSFASNGGNPIVM